MPLRLGVPRRVPALLCVALVAVLTLAGCSDDGDGGGGAADGATSGQGTPSTPAAPTENAATETPVPPKPSKTPDPLPSCEEIWVEGAILPKTYKGCVDEFGQPSKSVRGCSIGSKLGQYGDQYYAILGREIIRALPSRNENADYLDLIETCAG